MRITIAAVGRLRNGPMRDLCNLYLRRIDWPVRVIEVEAPAQRNAIARRAREGERLLRALPDTARTIVLDERGQTVGSAGFARRLADWRDKGVRDLAFVVGGADGFAPSVLERADWTVAFGTMTWPHELARVMLIEQIYRARTIMTGHPYHRGAK